MAGDVTDHLISVLFEESTDTTGLVYMRINDGTYYPIYDASGDFRSFDMAQIENTICFCSLVGGSVWQMLLTASYSPTIEVASSTDEEYILTINDINGSFDTANLKGTSGVWVGSEEPTDTSYNVWIIPEGEADFEVEDVLTSTSTTNALSANMGRELEVLITESEEKISTLETKVEELETYIEEQLGSINEALATILGE